MKCHRCGTDFSSSGRCSKCGWPHADYKEEIELEYKDFKTSELLEIRHKIQAEPFESQSEKETSPVCSRQGCKNLLPVLVIAAVLVLVLGVYVLFRFL